MVVLVTYDVSVISSGGPRRLRHIAKICEDYGIRVQKSVFECEVTPAQWEFCKAALLKTYDSVNDSLRFYYLGSNWKRRVEHHGTRSFPLLDDPLIL